MALRIIFLSEEKIFFLPISWIVSWPLPATSKISPVFKSFIASEIAFNLFGNSNIFCFLIPFLYLFLFYQAALTLDCHQ